MSHTRRDFIKYIVAGSIVSGCPVDKALLADPEAKCPSAMVGFSFVHSLLHV